MRKLIFLCLTTVLFITSCGPFSSDDRFNEKSELITSNLQEIDFQNNYSLFHAQFGTQTVVTIEGNQRVVKTNAIPNHQTGEFPNEGNPNTISAQNRKYSIPIKPTLSGESRWARQPGFALNGVKFEPETAERFVCKSGEVYRIEAFQDLFDLGLDSNNAHVQPTGEYHYHGVPQGLVKALNTKEDIVLVGFALDGFPIFYSKIGQYKPSYQLSSELRTGDACTYKNPHQSSKKDFNKTRPDGTFVSDWEYVAALGQLDECNGTTVHGQYAYFVTDEYPYMGRCLKGVFSGGGKGAPMSSHSHKKGVAHRH